ncbi:MAG: hypothetical protein NZ519_00510 [Bacteroidia bacterium]|nr:hypothetical protein [Bacteroidia bacterium]
MNISFEEKASLVGEIKIELEPQDYLTPVQQKIKEVSKRAQLPGFRPGKVPPSLLQKMYGKSILLDEINKIINNNVQKYLQDNQINILFNAELDAEKSPSIVEINNLNFNQPTPLHFYLNVVVKPKLDIDLAQIFSGEEFTKYKVVVSEEDVEEEITNISYYLGERQEAQSIEINDTIYGTLKVEQKPELDRAVHINLRKVPVSIAEKFLSKKVKDTVTLSLEALKEMYSYKGIGAISEEFLQNQDSSSEYIFVIQNIIRITPKPVDETFYSNVSEGKIKEKDAFYEFIKERLTQKFEFLSKQRLYQQIEQKLLEKVDIPLPKEVIKQKIIQRDASYLNLPTERQEKLLQENIEQLKLLIITENLLNKHNIQITDDDLKRQYILQLKQQWQYLTQKDTNVFTIEDIKLEEENPNLLERVEKALQNEENLNNTLAKVEKHYLKKILLENVPYTTKEISIVEFEKLKK